MKFILRTIGLDRKRFEQYNASILVSESDKGQISTLLYCITRNAEDALDSTNITKEDWKNSVQYYREIQQLLSSLTQTGQDLNNVEGELIGRAIYYVGKQM